MFFESSIYFLNAPYCSAHLKKPSLFVRYGHDLINIAIPIGNDNIIRHIHESFDVIKYGTTGNNATAIDENA